jgi:hypothetical protein
MNNKLLSYMVILYYIFLCRIRKKKIRQTGAKIWKSMACNSQRKCINTALFSPFILFCKLTFPLLQMRKSLVLTALLATCGYMADAKEYKTKVAILGGGVSGISAALNLTAAGITDFMMIEARDVLGGN